MAVHSLRDSTLLIAEANTFLDRLERPKTMNEIEVNLRSLKRIKDEMIAAGFNATFPEMMFNLKTEIIDDEISSDLSQQLRTLREFANLKKYTLNRVRVAIASHNILYNMFQRGNVCAFADYLPYNGEYLYELIYLGEPAIRAYNAINVLLSQKRESKGEYSVVISVEGKKQTLKLASIQNLGERIRRVYGEGATIVSITKKDMEKPLVNGKSNRIAIASAYARLAANIVYPRLSKSQMFSNELHKIYSSILSKYGLSSDTRVDLIETRQELEDELYSKKLLFEENNVKILHPDVVNAITKNRTKFNRETVAEAERLLSEDIFFFFMMESKKTRMSYPLFKGISVEIDERLAFISKYIGKNSIQLLKEKIALESFVPTTSPELAAVLMWNAGKSKEWCIQRFKLSDSQIEEAKAKLTPYLQHTSSQAKEFIDLLKKK